MSILEINTNECNFIMICICVLHIWLDHRNKLPLRMYCHFWNYLIQIPPSHCLIILYVHLFLVSFVPFSNDFLFERCFIFLRNRMKSDNHHSSVLKLNHEEEISDRIFFVRKYINHNWSEFKVLFLDVLHSFTSCKYSIFFVIWFHILSLCVSVCIFIFPFLLDKFLVIFLLLYYILILCIWCLLLLWLNRLQVFLQHICSCSTSMLTWIVLHG